MSHVARLRPPRPRYGKVSEVAEHLHVSTQKVRSLMEDGDLPFVRLGRLQRIEWECVDELIESNTIRS